MLELIVTCARSKSRAPVRRLCLRSVRRGPTPQIAAEWISRLKVAVGETIPAADLYRGDHWVHARRAADRVTQFGGRAWVCSAGYGLIPISAKLHPYSATFTPGDRDTVPDPTEWWEALAGWEGPAPGQPRRIIELVASSPDRILLVAVSEPYLRALTPSLLAARSSLKTPDRLVIICVGAPEGHQLADNILPCDARVQRHVGGALTAVNARVVCGLLQDIPAAEWWPRSFRERLAAWLAGLRPQASRVGRRVPDEVVTTFIRERLADIPEASWSALHREFRDSGLACVDTRFARLFRSIRKV
ncbi:MAG: hypothetical protein U0792_05495 [Gemmataceae bacterium]